VNSDHSNVAISRRSRIIDFVTSSLRERTVLVLLVLFGGAAAVILWQHSRIQSSQIQASAIRDAARYTDVIREFRTLYSSEVVSKAQLSGIEVSHDYEGKPGTIPLPATLSMELGNRIASTGSGGETRLYSPADYRVASQRMRGNRSTAIPTSRTGESKTLMVARHCGTRQPT
jgi:hypothetical protein